MIASDMFWRTVICGFIATFMMTMISFLQAGFGLPPIDIGHLLNEVFNQAHTLDPYSLFWGNAANMIIGILLALIWVIFLQSLIPGNWLVQGLIYGFIISFVAGLVVSPVVSLASGESVGIFYFDTWTPGLLLLAGLIMHLAYGMVLTLCLKYAGVNGVWAEKKARK